MAHKKKFFYSIGIMNGTSVDGIDISLIQSDGKNFIKPIFNKTYNYTKIFKNNIKNFLDQFNLEKVPELYNSKEFKIIDKKFSVFTSRKVISFLRDFDFSIKKVDLIGFHGQTIYHNAKRKISIQLGSGSKISEKLNLPVVSDFRTDDLLNGGQGAPLVPIFHQKIFSKTRQNLSIVNIGGISNLTLLIGKEKVFSTDIGPGNRLIDDFCCKYFNREFDKNGELSSDGNFKTKLVDRWLRYKIFKRKLPRSYDSTDFKLKDFVKEENYKKIDILSSLVFLSSKLIVNSNDFFGVKPGKIILCGGGARNKTLIKYLKNLCDKKIITSDKLGWSSDYIESQAFGYLAIRKLLNLHSTFPETTGVSTPTICGKIYNHCV